MKKDPRTILKQILSGRLTSREAVEQLDKSADITIPLAVGTPDGLFTFQGVSGLTRKEVDKSYKGNFLIVFANENTELEKTITRLNSERVSNHWI
ncbi:hypothetical protein [Pontibacter virosus]|uniref:Uncharacterized protein n=1 Tax=Pontibacter virosus TaxID=1765052 RepID=A0A2U1B3K8_9BACT|nr:hypothetical protein [Pontibacter virosus]PVY43260.1 hypothetical protein C8E01_102439 [Pontibacter virosus]